MSLILEGKKPGTLGKGLNNLITELNQDLEGSLKLISKRVLVICSQA